MLVIGYSWHDFEPNLLLRDESTKTLSLRTLPLRGVFNIEILPQRQCIGSFSPKGERLYCKNPVDERRVQCIECEKKDAFLPCVKCHGDNCAGGKEAREFCEKEKFNVYLALFGGVVKVGVSNEKRLYERLLEQGADIGAKIAEGNGKICRQIEKKISNAGIKDMVGYQTKIMALNRVHSEMLAQAHEFLKKSMPEHILSSIKILDFQKHYPKIEKSPIYLHIAPMHLSEKIIGAKGQLLFFESGKVINMKKLVARKINVQL